MANRIIQFKRNENIAANAAEAKSKIKSLDLANGEIVIGTYATTTNQDGSAKIIGVKANDKVFSIDNQTILDILGIDDNGDVNPLVTGSTVLKSIDTIDDNIDTLSGDVDTLRSDLDSVSGRVETLEDEIEAISGGTSADIAVLSAKTVTNVVDSKTIDFMLFNNTANGTKQISGDVKVSSASGNIIRVKDDGIYNQVDYNAITNALIVNGIEKPLNAGSIIDSIQYSAETESLVIDYRDTSGGTHSISAPLNDLIEEYEFEDADVNHNVSFTVNRSVSGSTSVQANISNYDCGEY